MVSPLVGTSILRGFYQAARGFWWWIFICCSLYESAGILKQQLNFSNFYEALQTKWRLWRQLWHLWCHFIKLFQFLEKLECFTVGVITFRHFLICITPVIPKICSFFALFNYYISNYIYTTNIPVSGILTQHPKFGRGAAGAWKGSRETAPQRNSPPPEYKVEYLWREMIVRD